jgi:hypothetical protein
LCACFHLGPQRRFWNVPLMFQTAISIYSITSLGCPSASALKGKESVRNELRIQYSILNLMIYQTKYGIVIP